MEGTTRLTNPRAQGDTVEIVAKFRARNAEKFGLRVRTGNGQRTVIGYDVDRGGIYVDRTRSGDVSFSPSFPSVEFAPVELRNGYVTLRVLVDRSSVEVFEGRGQGHHHRPDLPGSGQPRNSALLPRRPSSARRPDSLEAAIHLEVAPGRTLTRSSLLE